MAQGYSQETHKCPISLFMNVEEITRDVLEANELSACFKVRFRDDQSIRLQAFSKLGYEFDRVIAKEEFAKVILSETAYLYTLCLSTSNKLILDHIMSANRSISRTLILIYLFIHSNTARFYGSITKPELYSAKSKPLRAFVKSSTKPDLSKLRFNCARRWVLLDLASKNSK